MTTTKTRSVGEILKKEGPNLESRVSYKLRLKNISDLKNYLDYADLQINMKIKTNYETPGWETDFNCGKICIDEMHEDRVTAFLEILDEFIKNANNNSNEDVRVYILNEEQ